MIYDVRHVTTYTYGSPVTFAQCTLRVQPATSHGQIVEWSRLSIDPQPAAMTEHVSFFGNRVALVQIDVPHEVLRIEARSRVAVDRNAALDLWADRSWEDIRELGFARASMQPTSPAHFLYPSPLAGFAPSVTEYVGQSFARGRCITQAASEVMGRIRREFKYDPDATKVSTPLVEAFQNRHGVCQDFAHIMIAGLRGLGLSAAYVSGYIRTIPPAGKPRLEGGDASHAWVALWCGPDRGWLGFDPTNDIMAGDDHVVLGIGRDYADVAPVGGILQGTREQDVAVGVDVIPLLP
ncbi:transglutaminase family protein [Lichenihabitans sp. PAMC28606]|uniref:transglutaminase family protein n=1 Tax=Lichenihabitans sp. PAMC28606 TaxID=2880932 RepID=UPI001D0A08F1|nr:transglutaminase family protein [Lichenihabitans sp. PAMC28606]UDL95896.1 transglutaminase family protein [Lichenihabitans sp. PAMC28606]